MNELPLDLKQNQETLHALFKCHLRRRRRSRSLTNASNSLTAGDKEGPVFFFTKIV